VPLAGNARVSQVIALQRLKTGQRAEVSRVVGPADHVHRLEEFGLRCGTEIRMFRPGNPCILCMAGNKVCFRAENGLKVLVKHNGTLP
jgi:Fe2+ transport system protein FeoA